MARALVVVDVQNDFCEGGSVPVTGGAAVAAAIGAHIAGQRQSATYSAIVATLEHHVDPGRHFSETPDFVDTWPPHCVAGSNGADFHPALEPRPFDAVFRKGHYGAAYSGFLGVDDAGEGLEGWLAANGVTSLDVVGLATDHCVLATARDAVAAGLEVRVPLWLTAGVSSGGVTRSVAEMRSVGIEVVENPATFS